MAPKAPPLSEQGVHGSSAFFFVHPHRTNDQSEIQVTYSKFQNELQAIASKIGELEQEAEEHG